MADAREDVIRCEGIWKIFGDRSRQAMEAVRTKGLSKTAIREEFDCVVGQDEDDRAAARDRVKSYKDRGHDVRYFDLSQR